MLLLDISTNNAISAVAQIITLILIFIFVLALTYFTTRFVGHYQKLRMSGSNIQIMETFRISNSKYIQIVKIGKKYFAIAVCKDTVTYLCELDGEDLIYNSVSTESHSDNFKAILDKLKKDKPED
ncbi:MAG: flagellar biosynthetic protein FliO [Clostridia bacterium]|nr:flagellar biosynthetic protein FliO [Clostridia bacterium]